MCEWVSVSLVSKVDIASQNLLTHCEQKEYCRSSHLCANRKGESLDGVIFYKATGHTLFRSGVIVHLSLIISTCSHGSTPRPFQSPKASTRRHKDYHYGLQQSLQTPVGTHRINYIDGISFVQICLRETQQRSPENRQAVWNVFEVVSLVIHWHRPMQHVYLSQVLSFYLSLFFSPEEAELAKRSENQKSLTLQKLIICLWKDTFLLCACSAGMCSPLTNSKAQVQVDCD